MLVVKKNINWNIENSKPARSPLKKNIDRKHLRNNIRYHHYPYLLVIIFIFILRKFKLNLRKYPVLFGHQAFDIEYFLRRIKKLDVKDLFIYSGNIPNDFLFSKHKNLLKLIRVNNWIYKKLLAIDKISHVKFRKSIFVESEYTYKKVNIVKRNWHNFQPKIEFNENEKKIGESFLKKHKLKKFEYVIFASRNSTYYVNNKKFIFSNQKSISNTSSIVDFENKKAQLFRNSDFLDYLPSIKYLKKLGIRSIRLGASEDTVKIKDDFFIDYAGKYRQKDIVNSSFLDIFLLHHCKFFVNGPSGINAAIVTCKRPALVVNAFPWPWLCFPPRDIDMYIPKIYCSDPNNLIHFSDLLKLSTQIDWRTFYDSSFFENNNNLSVIDNTPNEILNAVKEMLKKTDGFL